MKLAEALIRKAAVDKLIPARFNTWFSCPRSISSFKDPDVLLKEFNDLLIEQEDLIKRINRTNCRPGPSGKKPMDLIARKESLTLKIMVLRDLYNAAQIDASRYSNKEIRLISTIDPKSIQKQIDHLSRELRETIVELQKLNWETDLLP
ncbi:MAG: DIP1984 family protein [Planctomycetia bacterium]|nr:DIP1984 family protein [Planctomycetia bacterium]